MELTVAAIAVPPTICHEIRGEVGDPRCVKLRRVVCTPAVRHICTDPQWRFGWVVVQILTEPERSIGEKNCGDGERKAASE